MFFVPFLVLAQTTTPAPMNIDLTVPPPDYVIEDFVAIYTVLPDGHVLVEENILANFNVPKHGIFRYIPTRQAWHSLLYNVPIKLISVTDDLGQPINVAEQRAANPFMIKLGDPDVTITGRHWYKIKYDVDYGVRTFNDHDEWYWNVTGKNWDTVINKISATVIIPSDVAPGEIQSECYAGVVGTQQKYCQIGTTDERSVTITNQDNWRKGTADDFTIVVGWPKQIVTPLSSGVIIRKILLDNLGLSLPIVVFIIMFSLWYSKGRDRRLKAIVAQYEEPKDITVLAARCLERDALAVDGKGMSAEIVTLAVRGYLKIRPVKNIKDKITDYILVKNLSANEQQLLPYQKLVMNYLFQSGAVEVSIDDLKKRKNQKFDDISEAVLAHNKKFYDIDPKIKLKLVIGCILIGGVIWLVAGALQRNDIFIGGYISLAIIIGIGWYMPRKSEAGYEMSWHLKGLKDFIKTAEQQRIQFFEKEDLFNKLLPYAMVFDLTKYWVTAFDGILKTAPDWYEDNGPFSVLVFSHAMSDFSHDAGASMTPSDSSSSGFGGGSSGGGGGGGGGGSW